MIKYGHQACPVCPSSDAFFVYKDGHGHCYSCGHHDNGSRSIADLKAKMNNTLIEADNIGKYVDSRQFTTELPKVAVKWLKTYDITNAEISHYRLMWNPAKETLVLPIFWEDGGSKLLVSNERYFGNKINHPKYLTQGNKTKYFAMMKNVSRLPGTAILCEDYISAIKISRQYTAIPLLGSTVPLTLIKAMVPHFISCRVWLDMNKATESIKEASRVSQFITDTRSIITELDPKEYSDDNIKREVNRSL